MAMYYYASKISAIACGTRCKQTVLQKSRGQRDRDKCTANSGGKTRSHIYTTDTDDDTDDRECVDSGGRGIGGGILMQTYNNDDDNDFTMATNGRIYVTDTNEAGTTETSVSTLFSTAGIGIEGPSSSDGIRYRRRHSEQLDICDTGLQRLEVSNNTATVSIAKNVSDNTSSYMDKSVEVQYDVPKNTHKRSQCDVNFESSVLGSGGIMYINGRIVSGPLESLIDVLVPKNINDLDKEFIFSFLLSSRLYLRPHVLLGKLLSSVPDSESLESLVAFLAEWTNKFPYDYRDERMMSHVKHIVARCSHTRLEATVSEILSALLKRLTDLERHEEELRSCQIISDKKKWDQPCSLGGPPGAQDPKKTCNLETYLDWSARLRLFVCNEILQCGGIRDRSRTVELWSGVAQYCLLVGNYNSATAILETLESPPIARLKITWSKLQVTCQQLDCMQRHAEGHGNLWHKQAIVLNENHHYQQLRQRQHEQLQLQLQLQQPEKKQKTEIPTLTGNASVTLPTSSTTTTATANATALTSTSATTTTEVKTDAPTVSNAASRINSTSSRVSSAVSPTLPTTCILGTTISTSTPTSTATIPTASLHKTTAARTNDTILKASDSKNSITSSCGGGAGGSGSSSGSSGKKHAKEILSNLTTLAITTSTTTSLTFNTSINTTVTATTTTTTLGTSSTVSSLPSSSHSHTSHTKIAINSTATKSSQKIPTAHPTNIAVTTATTAMKPNDWVVIPVFADIVKLALTGRENCLQRFNYDELIRFAQDSSVR
uniref:N-terminal Ras-GEF domain-containing protein n=1 Tax=Glossina brevipalpis TaxID=37001 RepID=A0A1A9WZ42_9MUSC